MASNHDFRDDAKASEFKNGQIVHVHPGCDAWMQGDRHGVVAAVGRKYVTVRLTTSGRKLKFAPSRLATDSIWS